MLIRQQALDEIARGAVSVVFRRWRRARVRVGTELRTSVGVLRIDSVRQVSEADIGAGDARSAGFGSVAALLAETNRHGDGELYRIVLHLDGPDPRVALRERAELSDDEVAAVLARLARMDAAASAAWTRAVLALVAEHAGVPARELAERSGWPTDLFKRRVRNLKELGLTESLTTGYRLSPRGRTVLGELDR